MEGGGGDAFGDMSWLTDLFSNSGGGGASMPAGSPDLIPGSPVSPGGPGDSGPISLENFAGGAQGASTISSLLRALGLTNSGGDPNGLGILSLLLPLLGGGLGYMATNKATGQITDAVNAANASNKALLGGASDAYKPFAAGGLAAFQNAQAHPYQPLAGNFRSLGSGAAMAGGGMPAGGALRGFGGGGDMPAGALPGVASSLAAILKGVR